jgi:hypothetical protein
MADEYLDARGRETSIFKLWKFHREGMVHMLFYRILIFVSLISAAVVAFSAVTGQYIWAAHALLLAIWLLFTPQLFGMFKVLAIGTTDGIAFGHLEKSYLSSIEKRVNRGKVDTFTLLPYLAVVVWIALLCAFALVWFA